MSARGGGGGIPERSLLGREGTDIANFNCSNYN